jgi:hypothetical protein
MGDSISRPVVNVTVPIVAANASSTTATISAAGLHSREIHAKELCKVP